MNGLPLALGAVALLAAAGRVKRGSAAVALPYAARPMNAGAQNRPHLRAPERRGPRGVTEVRKGSAMLWTPAELDNQIAQIQRGIARRKEEIASMEPRAGWGPGYARALSEKREALAYHERELTKIRAQRAEWGGGKGSAARDASEMDLAAANAFLARVTARSIVLHKHDPGFELVLCIDGKRLTAVSDAGRGGAYRWRPLSAIVAAEAEDLRREIDAAAKVVFGADRFEARDSIVAGLADGGRDGAHAAELIATFEKEMDS